jgi:hypothetical protein
MDPYTKKYISRTVDLDPAKLHTNSAKFLNAIQSSVDVDLIDYLKNPWVYLTEKFHIKRTKDEVLNKFSKRNFQGTKIKPLNWKIVEHEDLPGYVIKGNSSQASKIRNRQGTAGNTQYDHLLRYEMSLQIEEAIRRKRPAYHRT